MDISPRKLLPPSIWSKVTQDQRDQFAVEGTDLGLAMRKAERDARDLLADNWSIETEKEAFALLRDSYRKFIEGAYDLSVKAALDLGVPFEGAIFGTGKRLGAELDDGLSPDKTEAFRLKDVLLERQLYWRSRVLRERPDAKNRENQDSNPEDTSRDSTETDAPENLNTEALSRLGTQERQSASTDMPNEEMHPRRADVDAYIDEVFQAKGTRITKSQIWRKAGYKDKSTFQRWCNGKLPEHGAADTAFRTVLREKPHLKNPELGRKLNE